MNGSDRRARGGGASSMRLASLALFTVAACLTVPSWAQSIPEDPFAPPPGLSDKTRAAYERGRLVFSAHWRPSGTDGPDDFDGLGPLYNRASCASCHNAGGRGRVPDSPDRPFFTALVRVGQVAADGAVTPHPRLGGQVQDRALLGVDLEARLSLEWVEEEGTYRDGTPFSLRRPKITIDPDPGPNTVTSIRIAQPIRGLGPLQGGAAGFGWKGAQPDLRHQNAAAFSGDMGLTSSLFPAPICPAEEPACGGGPNEVGDKRLDDLTVFVRHITPLPPRTKHPDPDGAQLFASLGCIACHDPVNPALTDMRLHDMGPGLDDGLPEGEAKSFEWRTQPLRGLGTILARNPRAPLLHDGRARGAAEAILWHGGEAAVSSEAFRRLDLDHRESLIRYLEGL